MMKRISSITIALLVLLACPAPGGADEGGCPKRPDDEEKAKALAGDWFARGEKMVEQRRDSKALQAFNCSLDMVEHPATLFNAGQAARLVGKHTMALKLLRRYLELSPRGQTSDKARQFISELEQEEQDASLEEDWREPAGEPGSLDLHGAEGETDHRAKALRTGGYVSLGLGSAGVVAGTVVQILAGKIALGDAAEAEDYDAYQRLDEQRRAYQIGAVVGFAVGAAAIGAGLAMIVMAAKGEREKLTGLSVSVVPGFGMVTIVGRF